MIEITPKYHTIKKHIVDKINKEEFALNQLIPSERELMDQFGVSRITVRKAIDDLVNEGYLYRVQGKGTYVKSDDYKQDLFSITGCTEDIERMGMVASRKVIEQVVMTADKVRQRRLGLSENDEVLKIVRVYYADTEPLNYTITYLPLKLFPNLDKHDFQKESIYDVIENEYDVKIKKATRTLEAVLVHDDVSENLNMKKGNPILLFRAITYGEKDGQEIPIESFKSYYRSDKFKFYINQVR